MHHVELFRLQPHQIAELRNPKSLYCCDFRAISTSISEKSWWVYYYENMLLPIIEKGYVVSNPDALPEYTAKPGLQYVIAKKSAEVLDPVISRVRQGVNWDEIEEIWMAVPHPEVDKVAVEKGKQVNYDFEAYVRNNNKLDQKSCIPATLTPVWEVGVQKPKSGYLLKHSFGCGGLEVWHPDQTHNLEGRAYTDVVKETVEGWYQEQLIDGLSCSVSLYTSGADTIIFGWSELIFPENAPMSCLGGVLHDPSTLPQHVLTQLMICINALQEGVLQCYQGFWGIDFIIENTTQDFYFLEANVRVTTLTVPQLLLGKLGRKEGVFREDITLVGAGDIITNREVNLSTYDVLSPT